MFLTTHFPRAKKFWYMGSLYDWCQAHIHTMSHALHYGTSVFEGIRAYKSAQGPAIFRLHDHLERLFHSASVLKMKVPYTEKEIADAIISVVKENNLESAYIRPLLFYSYGNLGLLPKACRVELAIAAWEWGAYLGEKAEKGVHVYIVPFRRIHHSQFDMKAKLGGMYVQSAICGQIARENGCDEALFLNLEGNIAEGPGENIFIVKDKRLRTNDRKESILEGITRASLLEIANDMGIDFSIEAIRKEDLFTADEAFFCGTAVEIIPIIRVTDASRINTPAKEYKISSGIFGEMTRAIKEIYLKAVRGEEKRYQKWLTYVKK